MTEPRFLDPMDLRVIDDGTPPSPLFELLAPCTFHHPEREIIIDAGFQSKGYCYPFIGLGAFDNCLRAGILLDWLRTNSVVDRGTANRFFADALTACGVRARIVRQCFITLSCATMDYRHD